jgi:hypothetical protein
MLLLDVQVEIAADKETILNDWYYLHVPHLVSVPGYDSGRRYVSLTSTGPRYLALYEIRNRAVLPSLLGSDHSKRHPLTLSEWSRWDSELVPHMSFCRTNLYEPVSGRDAPILHGDHALVVVRFDGNEANQRAIAERLADPMSDAVASEPDLNSAMLLHAVVDPATAWLNTVPDHLLILELAGDHAARGFMETTAAKALLDEISRVARTAPQATPYRQIARHWHW